MSASYVAPTSYAVVKDREKFERELVSLWYLSWNGATLGWFVVQADTLQKALLNQETAPKEKHVRSIFYSKVHFC